MAKIITIILLGIILIVTGISQIKGNISLLHSYHRKRVKKKDIISYGKKVGLGSIIIGITIIIADLSSIYYDETIRNIILIVGFIPSFILIFYAMFKYNKGIF